MAVCVCVCVCTGLCCDPALRSCAVYLFEQMQVDVRVCLCVFLIQPSDKMQRAASGHGDERCEGKGEERMQRGARM